MPKTDQLHYSDSYRVLLIKLTTLRTTHDEMPMPTTDRAGDVPACVCVRVCGLIKTWKPQTSCRSEKHNSTRAMRVYFGR